MADDEVPYVPSVEEAFGETQGSAAPSRKRLLDPDAEHYVMMKMLEHAEPMKFRLMEPQMLQRREMELEEPLLKGTEDEDPELTKARAMYGNQNPGILP